MDLKNKSELEQYFAENFDTVLFPILAELYKNEKDYSRARKVCEIGLEYHPNNVPGAYILAEINQLQGNLPDAEKFYKQILSINPWHYKAAVNLVKIETELKRSEESIAKLWNKILKINPTHAEAKNFFKASLIKDPAPLQKKAVKDDIVIDKSTKVNKNEQLHQERITEKVIKNDDMLSKKRVETEGKENKTDRSSMVKDNDEKTDQRIEKEIDELKKKLGIPQSDSGKKDIFKDMASDFEKVPSPKHPTITPNKISEEELQALDITPRMATFTMVNVLKKQKLFQQALYVLKMLEEKGADQALIDQERHTIQELLDKSESN